MRVVSVAEMSQNVRSAYAQWGKGRTSSEPGDKPGHASRRLLEKYLELHPTPKIALPKVPRVFAMGSCFAREIERGFKRRAIPVLSMPRALTSLLYDQSGMFDRGIMNRYNTVSMELEFRNLLEGPGVLADDELLGESRDGIVDMHYYGTSAMPTVEKIGQRRQLFRDALRHLRNADVIVVTLGLAEACFDLSCGKYRNGSPSINEIRQKKPLEVHFLDYDANLASLNRIYELVQKHCTRQPVFVVTVSPVPLTMTYFSDDVIIANSEAKATLRAAAAAFANAHERVVYFPSYEIVTLSERRSAYKGDMRHVEKGIVDYIVETFCRTYGIEDQTPPDAPKAADDEADGPDAPDEAVEAVEAVAAPDAAAGQEAMDAAGAGPASAVVADLVEAPAVNLAAADVPAGLSLTAGDEPATAAAGTPTVVAEPAPGTVTAAS